MTREEAFEAILKYDGVCHEKYIVRFCRYAGITVQEFWRVVESYRNKDIVQKNVDGKYSVKGLEDLVSSLRQKA